MAKGSETKLSADPFTAGRTEAADRYGHLAKNAATWRRIAVICFLFSIGCMIFSVYKATEVKVVPFIVQTDQHGFEIAVRPVTPSKVDNRLIIAHIARYVFSYRTVMKDSEAQLQLINYVYDSTAPHSAALTQIQEFYTVPENNPLRPDRMAVFTTVNSVLPLSKATWQAEWTEKGMVDGLTVSTRNYRGIFEVVIDSPTDMGTIMKNPLGIYVNSLNFSEILN